MAVRGDAEGTDLEVRQLMTQLDHVPSRPPEGVPGLSAGKVFLPSLGAGRSGFAAPDGGPPRTPPVRKGAPGPFSEETEANMSPSNLQRNHGGEQRPSPGLPSLFQAAERGEGPRRAVWGQQGLGHPEGGAGQRPGPG